MRIDLKIDFVAPPFAGHLFPLLQLSKSIRTEGYERLRFFSCPRMRQAVENVRGEFLPLLADKEAEVLDLLLGPQQIMYSAKGIVGIVNKTLDLMQQFSNELRDYWRADRPDLIIVDHISPFAGIVADELGIPWWTAINIPAHLEVRKGTPTCLGGWEPLDTVYGRCRDAAGRWFVRTVKKTVHRLFRKRLRALGLPNLYRADGSERVYSNDVILGFGIPEFYYQNEWPKAMHWIGPCPGDPSFLPPAPHYEKGKKHILVSLGTLVPWTKEHAKNVFREVARVLPEYVFHFTLGSDLKEPLRENNLHFFSYLPYTPESFRNYDVIVNHGGTGVLFTAMMAGVPQLIWPQDFDQPDNAARVNVHGLGLRTRGKPKDMTAKIIRILENDSYREVAEKFRRIIEQYHPGRAFVALLQERFPC